MRLIVLTGLVTIEKIQLATELAQRLGQGPAHSVRVLNNVGLSSMHMTPYEMAETITGDVLLQLPELLLEIQEDVVILAASEQIHPDDLVIALDQLEELTEDVEILTLALIDLRTCDCFPNLRERLELYADVVVKLPYGLDEVIAEVNIA